MKTSNPFKLLGIAQLPQTPFMFFPSCILLIVILLLSGCQKNLNSEPPINNNSGQSAILQQNECVGTDAAAVATDWYNLQLKMLLGSNPAKSPLAVNRMFGYMGISLFEAARFEIPGSISLSGQLNEMPDMPKPNRTKKYSWVGSANAALANITRDMFPGLSAANLVSIDSLESIYLDKLTASEGAEVVARSQEFGDSVAATIFAWAKTDLFDHIADPYTPPVGPGLWVPTPPAFAPAAGPYTGNCRPLLKMHDHMNVIPLPIPYSEEKKSAFYKMEEYSYQVTTSLTEDQTNMALFWNDNGVGNSYTPMGHNISIITQILTDNASTLAKAEEAYLKAGMAMWDATIVCWRAKYKYNLLRPITYIQANIDASWQPLIVTPPHPEYPAAHAFITSAVMQAMNSVFGNHYSFTDHTYDFLGYPERSYQSFEDAANECAISRVYGGIHYLPSVKIARTYGRVVGEQMTHIQLTKQN